MQTSNWTFTPTYQPTDQPATFTLRPLDQRTLYELQRFIAAGHGAPTFDGASLCFEYAVIGWQGARLAGEPIEFSAQSKAKVLTALGDPDWMIWLFQIAGELYRRAFLTEDERKNS